ncbi:MAG: hypothetical protein AMJ75_10310 [Phycisphaerae bacterium SM1_79]|nr:MAG: hypothetical protein AMJ75_10310 [Phycisphaerae bacterium SM1_79]
MRNRISERISILRSVCKIESQIIFMVLVAVFVLTGCEQKHKEDADVMDLARETEVISVQSDEAERALEATGGLNAWKKTTMLQLDCVVTFYQTDGSCYLTEQHYEVRPWLNSIQISAEEPQGTFIWKFSRGRFNVLRGNSQIDALSEAVPSRCFAEVILNIITAPARFLDDSVEFSQKANPVKIRGQWYYPIERQSKGFFARVSEAVFYQDRDSSLVDMIRLACLNTGAAREKTIQYVRGYDYEEVEKEGPLVPTRIEIFESDARDRLQKRVVKIDCHTIRRSK